MKAAECRWHTRRLRLHGSLLVVKRAERTVFPSKAAREIPVASRQNVAGETGEAFARANHPIKFCWYSADGTQHCCSYIQSLTSSLSIIVPMQFSHSKLFHIFTKIIRNLICVLLGNVIKSVYIYLLRAV